MSTTITISGNTCVLTADFYPPLYIDDGKEYLLGLVDFETYMSIPNIQPGNDKFYVGDRVITIPEGTYDLSDIEAYIVNKLKEIFTDKVVFLLKANSNTLKSNIFCSEPVDFSKNDSIGRLLGFEKRIIAPLTYEQSDNVVNINKVNAICIDCNICVGSFNNGKPVHIIHQFFPAVAPGYKIVESPLPILYFPVSVKTINSVTIKILDQDGDLINFRNETITVRLHLKTNNGDQI